MGNLFQQYGWIFNLVAILCISFFSAKIAGLYIAAQLEVDRSVALLQAPQATPSPQEKKTIDDYQMILERNIFDSSEREVVASSEDVDEEEIVPAGEAVLTSLNLNVLGVLVVGSGSDSRSSATISSSQGGRGAAGVYAVGDEESFAPNTRLTKVSPDRIEFLHNGRLEYAEVGSGFGESIFGPPKRDAATVASAPRSTNEANSASVLQEAPGKYVIDQKEVDNALQSLDKLYTEIRAVPNFSGGKVSGMKILSVKGGSIFDKLGLKRGDILQRINGLELDVKQGFQIFSQLKDSRNLTVDLIRHGQNQTFEYEIR